MWKSPLKPVRANTSGSCSVNVKWICTVAPGSIACASGKSTTVSSSLSGNFSFDDSSALSICTESTWIHPQFVSLARAPRISPFELCMNSDDSFLNAFR